MTPDHPISSAPTSPRPSVRRIAHGGLLALLVAAVAWCCLEQYRTHRQNVAIAAIRRLGGYFEYRHQAYGATPLPGPLWLQAMIGEDHFVQVATVVLGDEQATDAAIEPLAGLAGLRDFTVCKSPFTGAGLKHLGGARQLRLLCLNGLPITNASLLHLRSFPDLCELYLAGASVDVVGLRVWPTCHDCKRSISRTRSSTTQGYSC